MKLRASIPGVGLALALVLGVPLVGFSSFSSDGPLAPMKRADVGASTDATTWDPLDILVSDPTTTFGGPARGLREPVVAVNPSNPSNLVAFAIDLNVRNMDNDPERNHAYASFDGGATWEDAGFVLHPPETDLRLYSGDPSVVFDATGTAYFAGLQGSLDSLEHGGVYIFASTDGGSTWTERALAVPRTVDRAANVCSVPDKELLVLDPTGSKLYLAYDVLTRPCDRLVPSVTGFEHLVAQFVDGSRWTLFLKESSDGGVTWSDPVGIWDGYVFSPVPRVGPDGTLYVGFWAATLLPTSGTCPSGQAALFGDGMVFADYVVAASKNGGESWNFRHFPMCEVPISEMGPYFLGRLVPSLAVDQGSNVVYFAYSSYDGTTRTYRVSVTSSADGGASWSPPVTVSQGERHGVMHSMVASDGVARLVYVGAIELETYDVFFVESADGGATWSAPLALNSKPSTLENYPAVGDYIWLDEAGGRIVAIWPDVRDGKPPQIYVRAGTI